MICICPITKTGNKSNITSPSTLLDFMCYQKIKHEVLCMIFMHVDDLNMEWGLSILILHKIFIPVFICDAKTFGKSQLNCSDVCVAETAKMVWKRWETLMRRQEQSNQPHPDNHNYPHPNRKKQKHQLFLPLMKMTS